MPGFDDEAESALEKRKREVKFGVKLAAFFSKIIAQNEVGRKKLRKLFTSVVKYFLPFE